MPIPPSVSRTRSRASRLLLAMAMGCVFSTPVFAQAVWTEVPTGNYTSVSGTLGSVSIMLSSSYPSGSNALGTGFSIQNSTDPGYHIWDNSIPQNSAQLYPASAVNASKDIVMVSQAGSTAADPNRVKVRFGAPVLNPTLLFFSIDSSTLDFTPARTAAGVPATLSFTTNSAALVSGKSVTRNPAAVGTAGPEGCQLNSTRACGVVQFTGWYDELLFDAMGDDGVGMQIGTGIVTSLPAAATPVPASSGVSLAATVLSVMGLAAWLSRRRHRRG